MPTVPMRVMLTLALLLPVAAAAADRKPSHCFALAQGPETLQTAAFGSGLGPDDVRLRYVGHSTYLLETPGGIGIATDFSGHAGPDLIPTAITMNRAHSTHWTPYPDPGIAHVLKGWGEGGAKAEHWLDLGDEVLIRNVTTDIRSGGGVLPDGNSIFIFEVAGLCIGHLGHLHHEPSEAQYAAIGRLDVVMAPVDGGMTVDLPTMIRTLKRLRAQVVLPMHWFGRANLERFVAGMAGDFAVEWSEAGSTVLSLGTLPDRPTIRVMMPGVPDRFD